MVEKLCSDRKVPGSITATSVWMCARMGERKTSTVKVLDPWTAFVYFVIEGLLLTL